MRPSKGAFNAMRRLQVLVTLYPLNCVFFSMIRFFFVDRCCLEDKKLAERMAWRRKTLVNEVFKDFLSPKYNEPNEPLIWVRTDVLLDYIDCKAHTDKSTAISLFDVPPSCSCEHDILEGRHPRIARYGKLLPAPMLTSLLSCMLKEYHMSLSGAVDEVAETIAREMNTLLAMAAPGSSMYCAHCNENYVADLRPKLEQLETIRNLYSFLDPKNDFDVKLADDEPPDDEPYAYIVSRRFITRFRHNIAKAMKLIAAANAPMTEVQDQGGPGSLIEGLEYFDLSFFGIPSHDQAVQVDEKTEYILDPRVNTHLTCKRALSTRAIPTSLGYSLSLLFHFQANMATALPRTSVAFVMFPR